MPRRLRVLLISAIAGLFVGLTGCTGIDSGGNAGEGIEEPEPRGEGIHFTWSPEEGADSAIYMLMIHAGSETSCTYHGETSGFGSSPEGLAYYEYWEVVGVNSLQLSAYFQSGRPYAHVSSVNTGQVSYMATEFGINAIENETIANGTSVIHIIGKWGLEPLLASVESAGPWVDVRCDSRDASIQFFKPDNYVVIDSRHATGGQGFSWEANTFGVHINQGDSWSIETDGRHIHFGSMATPRPDSTTGPYQEGAVVVQDPLGEEYTTLEDGEPILLGGRYNETGTYTIHFDWVSRGYTPYLGLLAGFVNERSLGDREADIWRPGLDL